MPQGPYSIKDDMPHRMPHELIQGEWCFGSLPAELQRLLKTCGKHLNRFRFLMKTASGTGLRIANGHASGFGKPLNFKNVAECNVLCPIVRVVATDIS
jgi:hypothetical protein